MDEEKDMVEEPAPEKRDASLRGDNITEVPPQTRGPVVERKINPYLPIIVSGISAAAAVIAASVAVVQAINASKSSNVAVQSALTSQRLSSCISMNQSLEEAATQASWADVMNKPYGRNSRFLAVMMAVHTAGEEVRIFRQMTPGQAADKLFVDVFKLRITLKDMVADGGDYLNQDAIRQKIRDLSSAREILCNRMIAPPGGY